MSKTRNLSDLLDANGDVKSTALDNVPASDVVNDTTPQLGGDLDTNNKLIQFGDSSGGTVNRLQFGASQDLQIYHDGSHSYILDSGTGNLTIRGTELRLNNSNNSLNYITCTDGGATTLFHNGVSKLATTSSGATVTGTLTATAFSGDGSALTNVPAGVSSVKTVVFTSSGTYTPTSGTKFVTVYATGGGGGSGGLHNRNQCTIMSGAGGGGGTAIRTYDATELGANASISIGSGGSAGSYNGDGGTGGNTSFNPAGTGTTITGNGGTGGTDVDNNSASGLRRNGICGRGGNASGGQVNLVGNVGNYHAAEFARNGTTDRFQPQVGGSSFWGGTDTWNDYGSGSSAGVNGVAYGSGATGAIAREVGYTTINGGSGKSGIVVIMEYA